MQPVGQLAKVYKYPFDPVPAKLARASTVFRTPMPTVTFRAYEQAQMLRLGMMIRHSDPDSVLETLEEREGALVETWLRGENPETWSEILWENSEMVRDLMLSEATALEWPMNGPTNPDPKRSEQILSTSMQQMVAELPRVLE